MMRFFVLCGLLICLWISGCEFFTPDTSRALSQTRVLEEQQKQTGQMRRQADALEELADAVERSSPRADVR